MNPFVYRTAPKLFNWVFGLPLHRCNVRRDVRYFASGQERMIVDIDRKTGIASMLINNPPINALNSELLTAATKAVKDAENNSDVRGIVLTSKLDGKVFSGGLNILDLYKRSHQHIFDYWTMVQDWYLAWYGCKKPTVAIINGHALAAGCAWVLMCDHRIMTSDTGSTIGFTEAQLGIVPPMSVVQLIVSTLGHRKAELVLLKASAMSAERVFKFGMVDEIDKAENLKSKAMEHLRMMLATPPDTYYVAKLVLRQKIIDSLVRDRKADAEWVASFVSQPEIQDSLGKYVATLKARKKK